MVSGFCGFEVLWFQGFVVLWFCGFVFLVCLSENAVNLYNRTTVHVDSTSTVRTDVQLYSTGRFYMYTCTVHVPVYIY